MNSLFKLTGDLSKISFFRFYIGKSEGINNLNDLEVNGYDSLVNMNSESFLSDIEFSFHSSETFLLVKTSDVLFNINDFSCSKKVVVTYDYSIIDWLKRLFVLVKRKFVGV